MKPILWHTNAGEITLLPQRGRVLQATLVGQPAFWVPPRFDENANEWNVGGDRLWVAPELDWFWKTRQELDFKRYEIPRALDPGTWQLEVAQDKYCSLSQNVVLRNQHDAQQVEFELARGFQLLDWQDVPFLESSLCYRTDNELWLRRGQEGTRLDLWSIAQVPPGGVMSLGVRGEGKTWRDYFAPLPDELCEENSGVLQLQITGDRQFKIGVSPSRCTGRIAYVRLVDARALVVLRQFFPQPWNNYCDSPMKTPPGGGDAVQVYNDDGAAGGFGEMEFHSPCLCFGHGPQYLVDSNITLIGLVEQNNVSKLYSHWFSQSQSPVS